MIKSLRSDKTHCNICKKTIYFKFEDGVRKAFDLQDMPHSCLKNCGSLTSFKEGNSSLGIAKDYKW